MNKIVVLNEENFDEIFSLSQFAFQYELSEKELQKKKEEANRHTIWAILDGERIAAKLHLIPLTVNLNGSSIEMGGISSVATWPEYRRQGMVKDLLLHSLKKMREKNIPLSFLHPFSIPFYRQFGWELAFNNKHYGIPIRHLKKDWQTEGYVKRHETYVEILDSIYNEYAKKYNGTLIRDQKWWKQRVLKDDKNIIAVAYNNKHQPEGYMIYNVKDRLLNIKEFVYTQTSILKVMLQYLANHDSMVDKVEMVVPENDHLPLLLDDPNIKQIISPYFMARIVDVPTFLHKYFSSLQIDSFSLTLNIHDPFMPDNSGTYLISKEKEQLRINASPLIGESELGISCYIQELASMLLGYRRPIELYELEQIHGDDKEIKKLDSFVSKKQTYFQDFF